MRVGIGGTVSTLVLLLQFRDEAQSSFEEAIWEIEIKWWTKEVLKRVVLFSADSQGWE